MPRGRRQSALDARKRRRRTDSNTDDSIAREFVDLMQEVKFNYCHLCKRLFPELAVDQQGICSYCRTPKGRSKFNSENDMDPGPVLPELQGLSLTEQCLIARVHPIVSLYKIRG